MTVNICATIVLAGVGGNAPKYPKIKKDNTKIPNAVLDIQPLYLIDLTGLLSNHGNRKNIITANPINITPHNFAGIQKKFTVLARNIE